MPKLWTDTIDEHRRAVREATIDAAATLVAARGLRGVTMSAIAEATGIGRATLYKYFPDVESILVAWHERRILGHLEEVAALAHRPGAPSERLENVLDAYAQIQHQHPTGELAATLHRGEHVAHAEQHLRRLLRELVRKAVRSGDLRSDVPADELVAYCLHALAAASAMRSPTAVRRLVRMTIDGMRPR